MITSGFMEMTVYPKAIILLAQQKTEDIQSYIQQLSSGLSDVDIQPAKSVYIKEAEANKPVEVVAEIEEKAEDDEEEEIDEVDNEETTDDDEEDESPEIVEDPKTIETSVVNEIPATKEYDLSGIIENSLISRAEPKTILEERKTVLGEKNILVTPSRNEMLSKADNSISSTLANKKIDDIKQAINIGDRFRFQRELFRGNGEDMNKTLTYINLLITQEEALSFLQSKYGWASDNETAEDFYQLVKRRFL
jgi:hypothetical protein